METISEQITELKLAAESLSAQSLTTLDFDQLRETLRQQVSQLTGVSTVVDDHAALRQDYIGRIAGMAKAIAVVARRRDAVERAVEYVESLGELDAKELIEQYRLTAARFREAFPGSFAVSTQQTNSRIRQR